MMTSRDVDDDVDVITDDVELFGRPLFSERDVVEVRCVRASMRLHEVDYTARRNRQTRSQT